MSIFDVHLGTSMLAFAGCLALGYFWYSPRVFGNAWRLEQDQDESAAEKQSPFTALLLCCLLLSWFIGVLVMLIHKGLLPTGGLTLALASFTALSWSSRRMLNKNRNVALIDSSFIAAAAVLSYLLHSIVY